MKELCLSSIKVLKILLAEIKMIVSNQVQHVTVHTQVSRKGEGGVWAGQRGRRGG